MYRKYLGGLKMALFKNLTILARLLSKKKKYDYFIIDIL